jgi:RecA-family ATPase
MRSLARAIRGGESGGAPLPVVLPSLAAQGAHIRRGEVTMLAGQPGAGKSTIALWHSIIWAKDHGLIGIYFSADSSELVAASRTAAMVLNQPVKEMEKALQNTDSAALEAIAQTAGISWCFDPEITLDGIDLELAAFEEMWGRVPDFVCIDNATDVEQQDGDEFGALRRVMRDLTYLARTTSAAVLVLHHTSENEKDDPCPPRKAIHGKVSVKPALVLTTAETWTNGRKPIAIVKSRFGRSNKLGKDPVWINQDAQSLAFTDDWQVA